jgi:flagellar basal-body rod protein FlgG
MLEGLYSAASGMVAQQERMDALANDVANVSTTGYKHVRVAFRDLLYTQDRSGRAFAGAGAAAAMQGRALAQGALRTTDRQLDVAIEGDGFLQVRRPDGTLALTRDGSLRADARGRLGTADGALLEPPVRLPVGVSERDVRIEPDGSVSAGARRLGRIQLVTVRSPAGLRPDGESQFVATAASGPAAPAGGARLVQGTLESSNVDLGDALVDMMDAQRSFAMASRAVQTQDQLLQIANGLRQQ